MTGTDETNHYVNPELQASALIALADFQQKMAAQHHVHPAMRAGVKSAFIPGQGMDPAAAGGDPNAGAGADPSGGMAQDPSAGGGAPPQAPMASPQMAMQPVEPIKPKIDVNVELMQIKKMLARICDGLHIPIPASEMAITSQDLTQNAMQQSEQGGGQQSMIPPISPIGGKTASASSQGTVFDGSGLTALSNRAMAIAQIRGIKRS